GTARLVGQGLDPPARAIPERRRTRHGSTREGCSQGRLGVLQLRRRPLAGGADSTGQVVLRMPQRPWRGGYHFRGVLPDAAADRETAFHAERGVPEGRGGSHQVARELTAHET